MPYTTILVRVPAAGNMSLVVNAVKANFAASGVRGFVTTPVSSATLGSQSRPGVISALVGAESLDDVDANQNALMENEALQARLDSIDALCEKNHRVVLEFLSERQNTNTDFTPKVVGRTMLESKVGRSPDLLETLMTIRSKLPFDRKPGITRPISGSVQGLMLTDFAGSLQELKDRGDEANKLAFEHGVPDLLATGPIRHIGKIIALNL
jgi:hypothetical protein